MADIFADLGLNKEEVSKQAGEQTVGGNMLPSGVYKFVIDKLYVAETDSGAKMLTMELTDTTNDKNKMKYSTCIKSGNSNSNEDKHFKSTYTTKTGKEVPLPGVTEMIHLQQALGVEFTTTSTEIDGKNGKVTVDAILNASGKVFTAGVKIEEGEYTKNFISAFLNANGENSKGENLAVKLAETIAKNPIRVPKGTKTSSGTSSAPKTEAPSGWN